MTQNKMIQPGTGRHQENGKGWQEIRKDKLWEFKTGGDFLSIDPYKMGRGRGRRRDIKCG
jgi:hypothetical protein